MKAFLIGLLAWSVSAYFATVNTLPYLSPAITLLGWCGATICIISIIVEAATLGNKRLAEEPNNFPKRKVDIEVPA